MDEIISSKFTTRNVFIDHQNEPNFVRLFLEGERSFVPSTPEYVSME